MAIRGKSLVVLILLVLAGSGLAFAEYQSRAIDHRNAQRREAVISLNRALDSRPSLPAKDGSLGTKAIGGLAEAGRLPERPRGTLIYYAVKPDSQDYFLCSTLERDGAFYANRHGTFNGPTESCRPDADPVAVGYVLDAKMTSTGSRAFLRSDPAFVSKEFIQQQCSTTADDGQLQGCYTGGRIYLIDLSEQEIRPEVSVTAAHEMLHAVWSGLSEEERLHLSQLLEAFARRHPGLRQEVASYAGSSRINEMHSIVGTELKDIGGDLERHYAKYLADRGLIVRRHLAYEKVLDNLNAEINRLKKDLRDFEAYGRSLRDKGDIDTYNAFVSEYNVRGPEMVTEINDKVLRFNRLTEHTRPAKAQ